MQRNACKVCGGADMNLVDGFYYCVECGTQDENIQERVVETEVFIGLHTKNAKSKIQTVKEKMNLGPEWCKWHAFNFIMAGLTDELIEAGAQPSVKMKVLWIWTKYMKLFKVKDRRPQSQFFGNDDDQESHKENNEDSFKDKSDFEDKSFNIADIFETHSNDDLKHDDHDEVNDKNVNDCDRDSNISEDDKYAERKDRMKALIENVSKGVIIAIFYLALNLDKSDIQLSHLLRYVKWRYVDISTCTKYIPKDLDVTCIPRFKIFRMSIHKIYKTHTIRQIAMSLMKFLNLGLPQVPDMRKLVDNYTKELCLPDNFKQLVVALMHQYPSRHIKMNTRFDHLVAIPDYEAICLSYFVVAFKLCFGLDDDYEGNLSNVVDKINDEKSCSKAYKMGAYSTSTDRLFSFREWCDYMKLRKMIVCKHNLRMARLHKLDVSDYVFLEHLDKVKTKSASLTNDIVKDVLNKIPLKDDEAVIPKEEFELSYTPMTSYTDVILDYIQDPDLRLMLSEDYTQYSLEYAVNRLQLKENMDGRNIITGISKIDKVINKNISGHFSVPAGDDGKMLYIRFCEKEDEDLNPLVTSQKRLSMESQYENKDHSQVHYIQDSIVATGIDNEDEEMMNEKRKNIITNNNYDDLDKDKSKMDDSIITNNDQRSIKFVDYPNASIYDDDNKDDVKQAIATINESFGTLNDNDEFYDYINSCLPSPSNKSYVPPLDNLDRRTMINELIRQACVKYKISLPPPKKPKDLTKTIQKPKKREKMPAELRNGINRKKNESRMFVMLSSYYKNILLENNKPPDDDIREPSPFNEIVQENTETTFPNDDFTDKGNESLALNSTVDCEVQENDVNEIEPTLDSDEDESDDEFMLPETAEINEEDIIKMDIAADKILEKETARCGMPPKKKLKLDENIANEKQNTTKTEKEKLLHPSAWGVPNFNYWIRHYSFQTQLLRSRDVHDTFNIELFDNLPKAFAFVLQECGSMIDSTPFRLYRQMEYVEKHILLKLKFSDLKRRRKSKKAVKK